VVVLSYEVRRDSLNFFGLGIEEILEDVRHLGGGAQSESGRQKTLALDTEAGTLDISHMICIIHLRDMRNEHIILI
jgi:hypothetical protein